MTVVDDVDRDFDGAVIGAGPAGGVAALALARAGWRVALIEKKAFPRRKVCGEFVSATNQALLDRLGVLDRILADGGPDVSEVGIFFEDHVLPAPMPQPRFGGETRHGRGVERRVLDTVLRDEAAKAGAEVFQPCTVRSLEGQPGDFMLNVRDHKQGRSRLRCRCVIAAHGSWERGSLPTQPESMDLAPASLLGFKAHFENTNLPPGLMPLLVFRGGYGGMVHVNRRGRVSLSLCIQKRVLDELRTGAANAGEAIERHLQQTCRGIRESLDGAQREGRWLSAGPIRPGIRPGMVRGVFRVGNAAGEAHPVVAEGLTMAMQSAGLLTALLRDCPPADLSPLRAAQIGDAYSQRYRQAFGPRIRAAAGIAALSMNPLAAEALLPFFRVYPSLISVGARLSGKTTLVQEIA